MLVDLKKTYRNGLNWKEDLVGITNGTVVEPIHEYTIQFKISVYKFSCS